MEQGSQAWKDARLGKVTASRVADVMAVTKSGPAAARKNYMMELLCERLTKASQEGYESPAMRRGKELESVARSHYEVKTGALVEEVGLIDHPEIEGFAASPDGLVADAGLVEIKCPNTAAHVDFLHTKKIPGRYRWQIAAQMACTGRKWCDFVSFDDRLPERLQMGIKRVFFDSEKQKVMLEEVKKFLAEIDILEASMLEISEQTKEQV